jgi:FAD/FMN-containing dehydrogenase
VLTAGDHARLDELPASLAKDPLRLASSRRLSVPFDLPEFTLNPLSVRLLNALIQFVQSRGKAFGHYEPFFYPLDVLRNWNRGYGRRGFTQYQFVIPFEDGEGRLREILTTIAASDQLPFLNVLKRMGKPSGGLLSFPREGYTLAIDFPIRRGTAELLHRLDRIVLDAGGRIYLGKDSFLQPQTFRAMYPEVERFREIKAKYDPLGVFTSNLSRRLELG